MTCNEPSGVAVPVASWAIDGDNLTLNAAGYGTTAKFRISGSGTSLTLTLTDAAGHVAEYNRT